MPVEFAVECRVKERALTRTRTAAIVGSVATVLAIGLGSGAAGAMQAGSGTTSRVARAGAVARTLTLAATDGRPMAGLADLPRAVPEAVAPRSASTGSGFLSIFQEASVTPLQVSLDGSPPVTVAEGGFKYGLVPSGDYSVTATLGATTVAAGMVNVPAGQDVTALVYLTHPGGVATVTGFVNDRSTPPLGQSRIVFRNAANVAPVDIYLNGTKIASSLTNDPASPTDATVMVGAGSITIVVTRAGGPISEPLYSQSGNLVAGDLLNVFVVGDPTADPSTLGLLTNANPLGTGYRLYASDGGVFNFGNSQFFGSMGGEPLNEPIVGATPTSIGLGYWLVASDGGIFSFGGANFYGSAGDISLNKPIVGMASTPDDGGYWLVASDGGVFAYGDAGYFGSTGGIRLNEPIVGMASTPDGKGYWLVASDGGVFAFGDAAFFGSTGDVTLNKPIVALLPTVDGLGYWLVASDGGVFAYGDAAFFGSTGNIALNRPVVGAVSTPDSLGYWLVASDGGIFSFGDASFHGSTGNLDLDAPVVWASAPGAPLPA
jgi:hypothetical protein